MQSQFFQWQFDHKMLEAKWECRAEQSRRERKAASLWMTVFEIIYKLVYFRQTWNLLPFREVHTIKIFFTVEFERINHILQRWHFMIPVWMCYTCQVKVHKGHKKFKTAQSWLRYLRYFFKLLRLSQNIWTLNRFKYDRQNWISQINYREKWFLLTPLQNVIFKESSQWKNYILPIFPVKNNTDFLFPDGISPKTSLVSL